MIPIGANFQNSRMLPRVLTKRYAVNGINCSSTRDGVIFTAGAQRGAHLTTMPAQIPAFRYFLQ